MSQPYNSLGQILSSGGDVAIAGMLGRGRSQQYVLGVIASRFPLLSPLDSSKLIQSSQQSLTAGRMYSSLRRDERPEPGMIPVVPELFGGEPDGRRVLYAMDYSIDGGEHWFTHRFESPDIMSYQEIVTALSPIIEKYRKGSPDFLGGVDFVSPENITVDIFYAARGF